MNIKIILFYIIIFISLILLLIFFYNFFLEKFEILNFNKDYLNYDAINFKNINYNKRWEIRFKVLENYETLKNNFNLNNININSIRKFKRPINKDNKIFVNIASYRDPECCNTINNLIKNCSNIKNLRIVVCEQNEIDDISAITNNENFSDIIEIIKLKASDAKGPTYARFLIQQCYNNEEFYLQIDSHTLFENNWDLKLIDSLNKLENKSCITQYLPEYNLKSNTIKSYSIRNGLYVNEISPIDGFTRITSDFVKNNNDNNLFFDAKGWSGCFSFSRGDICIDAPIDPLTPELFFGEEMDIFLRLYTRGWNFYSPNFPIAYTIFDRSYRNTFWKKKSYNKKLTLLSRLRVHYRLNTLPNFYKHKIKNLYPNLINYIDDYLLGNERTLEDFENLIGYDIIPN